MLAACRQYWRTILPTAVLGSLALGISAPASAEAPAAAAPAAPARAAPAIKKPAFEEIPSGSLKDPKDWKLKKPQLLDEGKFAEGAAGTEDATVFENHYKLLVIEMTQAKYRDGLHIKRYELRRDLNGFGRAKEKVLHTKLRDLMGKYLPMVFTNSNGTKNYSPPARFNALLAYGDLNAEEGDIGGAGAVPWPAALPRLIAVLKNQDPKNPFPSYLQPAALVGITRHLMSPRTSVTPENRKEIAQVLVGWLRNPPAQGLSPEVQYYLRRRAADLLRNLAAKGPEANNAEVASALGQFAADEEAPLDDRCETVRTLGVLDSKSFGEKNVPTVARTIALLAAEVGRQTALPEPVAPPAAADAAPADANAADAGAEPAAADAATPEDPAGAPAAAAPAAVAAVPVVAEEVSKSQNSLPPDMQTYLLLCLKAGLDGAGEGRGRGLAGAAAGDNKQLVADLTGKIDEMHKVVAKKKREDKLNEGEIRKLRDLATGLETIIGHQPAAAEGATEQARAN